MSCTAHDACSRNIMHMLQASTGLLPHAGMRASKPSHRYSRASTASQPNSGTPDAAACSSHVGDPCICGPHSTSTQPEALHPCLNSTGTNDEWGLNWTETRRVHDTGSNHLYRPMGQQLTL